MSSLIKALRRSSSTGLKHKKLCEEWGENREPVQEGVTFFVKYLGSCLVEQAKGERSTAEAIKTIVGMAKSSGKKLERVAFMVNPKRVQAIGQPSQQQRLEVPIYRISYCSADAYYDHIFAFVAVNANESLECHAFLCPKKKIAHAVTLTIAQAFNIAFEVWQNKKGERHLTPENISSVLDSSCSSDNHHRQPDGGQSPDHRQLLKRGHSQHVLLIDLDDDNNPSQANPWTYDEDYNCELNFEKFIQTRYYPPRLDTNLSPESVSSLHHYIASQQHLQDSQCFLQENSSCDLMSL